MKRELREESKREENREKIVELKKLKSDTREGYIKGSFFNFSLILSFVVMFKSLYSIINEKQYGYAAIIAIMFFCLKKLVDLDIDVADLIQKDKEEIKAIEDEILDNRNKRLNKRYNYMDYLNE